MPQRTESAFLGRNLDIAFGLAAWALGGLALLLRPWLDTNLGMLAKYLAIPTLWTQLALLAFRHRQRPLNQLFWIWFSAPLSLGYLVHGIMVFAIVLPRKF